MPSGSLWDLDLRQQVIIVLFPISPSFYVKESSSLDWIVSVQISFFSVSKEWFLRLDRYKILAFLRKFQNLIFNRAICFKPAYLLDYPRRYVHVLRKIILI